MKKLMNLALSVVVLATFTGLSTAQKKESKKRAAPPPPDMVTLSAAGNKTIVSKKGCVVNARPGKSGTSNTYPNFAYVNFEKSVSGGGFVPLTPNSAMTTNSQGIVQRTIPWNTIIRVWIKIGSNPKIYSDELTCGEQYPS